MDVVLLGDSQLVRLGKSWKPNLNVTNLAISGCNVEKAWFNFNLFLDDIPKPWYFENSCLVILLGTNDCKHLTSEFSFNRGNYKKIVRVASKIFKQVLICKIPPIPKFPDVLETISNINKWLNGFQSLKNVEIIDSFSCFLKSSGQVDLKFFEQVFFHGKVDLIHLNKKGLMVLSHLIMNKLK